MFGKIASYLIMVLVAFLAFRWLRGGANLPVPGGGAGGRQKDRPANEAAGKDREEDIITLERDPETGVYKPGDKKAGD